MALIGTEGEEKIERNYIQAANDRDVREELDKIFSSIVFNCNWSFIEY